MAFTSWFSQISNRAVHFVDKCLEFERNVHFPEPTLPQRAEVTDDFKNKLLDAEHGHVELTDRDARELGNVTSDASELLSSLQTKLLRVSYDITQLYRLFCMANGETPSVVCLSHGKIGTLEDDASQGSLSPKRFALSNIVKDLSDTVRIGGTLQEQVKHLRSSSNITIESLRNKTRTISDLSSKSAEISDLNEQVTQLKCLLSTKRKQMATLRSVLEENNRMAQAALNNLKTKYEAYRLVDRETTMKLRNELRLLKEDAASFSSLRATFATRCQEYQTQITEVQCQIAACNEKTSKQAFPLGGGQSRKRSIEGRDSLLQPVFALKDTTFPCEARDKAARLLARHSQVFAWRSQCELSIPLVASTSRRESISPSPSITSRAVTPNCRYSVEPNIGSTIIKRRRVVDLRNCSDKRELSTAIAQEEAAELEKRKRLQIETDNILSDGKMPRHITD